MKESKNNDTELYYEQVVAEEFNQNEDENNEYIDERDLTTFMPDSSSLNSKWWRYLVVGFTYLLFISGVFSSIIIFFGDQAFKNNDNFIREVDSTYATYYTTRTSINGLGIIKTDSYLQFLEDEGPQLLAVYEYEGYVFLINSYNTTLSDIDNNNWFVKVENNEHGYLIDYRLTEEAFNGLTTLSDDYLIWYGTDQEVEIYIPDSATPSFFIPESQHLVGAGHLRTYLYSSFLNLSVYLIVAAIMIGVTVPLLKPDFRALKRNRISIVFNELVVSVGIFYAFIIGGSIISSLLMQITNITPQTSDNQFSIEQIATSGALPLILLILAAVVIGPLVEELVFRKTIFAFFQNNKVALIVSSSLFSLIHLTTELAEGNFSMFLFGFISYAVGGLAFGYLYIRYHRNIWIPTLVHSITNLLSLLLILI